MFLFFSVLYNLYLLTSISLNIKGNGTMRWDRIGLIWRLDNKAAVPVKPIRNKALSDGGAGESSVALDGSESDMATRSNSTRLVLKDPSLAVSAHSFDLVHIPAEGILLETEADCIQFLYSMKWPNGFVCPYCSCKPFYKISTRRLPLYECASCRRQTSLITHTVMEGSRTPLQKWFQAIRLLACEGPLGVSANYLSSVLKVTYKTAWSMLHRIRAAMGQVQAGAALSGEVTIHDAYYNTSHHYTYLQHKQETGLLVGAALSTEKKPQRIRIQVLDPNQHTNRRICLEAAGTFQSESLDAQAQLSSRYLGRGKTVLIKQKKAMPLVYQAIRRMQRTYSWVSKKYLQRYWDEYCALVNMMLAGMALFSGLCRVCSGHTKLFV